MGILYHDFRELLSLKKTPDTICNNRHCRQKSDVIFVDFRWVRPLGGRLLQSQSEMSLGDVQVVSLSWTTSKRLVFFFNTKGHGTDMVIFR